jgi:hypothetical protein
MKLFINCKKCTEQRPSRFSMEEYSRIGVIKTEDGIQIWCVRHDIEIVFFPYEWEKSKFNTICKCEMCNGN